MFPKSLVALALMVAAVCGAPPKRNDRWHGSLYSVEARAIPGPGTYRIQNLATGYYMDASGSGQNAGNPVIGYSLNEPSSPNQEWKLSFSVEPEVSLESISSFIASTIADASAGTDMQGNGTMGLAMFPKIGASLKIEASTEDSNYNTICANTFPTTCATASSEFGAQIELEPPTGSANQSWAFQAV
ncbi:hypothetical protein PHLGIDRAFT_15356 [Phlebiopsis gigantea 11061_1 CR5-6]|uniref:Ricin B lectin domain-containing protein n=1 Tax=Phlebiopsis gigantea (strain 11061_1 CR5-6) TaxID=745531 RepID=A0A0C3S362_PHLG1|nr:hypothetical protein PHLGIDRAFT_15356 [Phlebiopsis gigantea 11061_1 CR5-6]